MDNAISITDEQIIELADECFPAAPDAWRTDYAYGDKATVIKFARSLFDRIKDQSHGG